jgi:uncharacterized lipoprotein YmbA
MRNDFSLAFAACALGLFVVVLSSCASSPPSKFYQFSALNGQAAEPGNSSHGGSEVVSIGPVRIPDYLDRPQIVTRSGQNELRLAEFDRWAGSIENDIIRVLAEDISAQLPEDRFFVIRWTPLLQSQLSSSYRVEMIVSRFDGPLDGAVTLRAQWGLFGRDKNVLVRKESVIVEKVNGSGYDAYVDAMSRAIGRLGKEIADGIVSSAAHAAAG